MVSQLAIAKSSFLSSQNPASLFLLGLSYPVALWQQKHQMADVLQG